MITAQILNKIYEYMMYKANRMYCVYKYHLQWQIASCQKNHSLGNFMNHGS